MDLNLSRIFIKVVQAGSFSRAAELLRVPKSTVSKSITKLERDLQSKLLLRTTRSLTLTESGKKYFEAIQSSIQQIEEAQRILMGQDSSLTGLLKITAPEDLGSAVIGSALSELTIQHSNLQFEIKYTDEIVDLVKEGFDLAVRIGKINSSSFRLKKVGEFKMILVASPNYLESSKKIKNPEDLERHCCLTFSNQRLFSKWQLHSKSTVRSISIRPRISCNQMTSVLNIALSGGGIAFVPDYFCWPYLHEGNLTQVLPNWTSLPIAISIISTQDISSSNRIRVTVDRLQTAIKEKLRPKG